MERKRGELKSLELKKKEVEEKIGGKNGVRMRNVRGEKMVEERERRERER